MSDSERAMMWNGLVASFPGETYEDKVLSALIYTMRELIPKDRRINSFTLSIAMDNGHTIQFGPARRDPDPTPRRGALDEP